PGSPRSAGLLVLLYQMISIVLRAGALVPVEYNRHVAVDGRVVVLHTGVDRGELQREPHSGAFHNHGTTSTPGPSVSEYSSWPASRDLRRAISASFSARISSATFFAASSAPASMLTTMHDTARSKVPGLTIHTVGSPQVSQLYSCLATSLISSPRIFSIRCSMSAFRSVMHAPPILSRRAAPDHSDTCRSPATPQAWALACPTRMTAADH